MKQVIENAPEASEVYQTERAARDPEWLGDYSFDASAGLVFSTLPGQNLFVFSMD